MLKQLIKKKDFIIAVLVFISRFGFLPANFSPLGSFGFLSKNFVLFFGGIILFDIIHSGFYPYFWMTYIGFLAYPALGYISKDTKSKLLLLPLSSFLFFLISNFGSYLAMYPHNIYGLISCYTNALPFYVNTLSSDIVFGYGALALIAVAQKVHMHTPRLT